VEAWGGGRGCADVRASLFFCEVTGNPPFFTILAWESVKQSAERTSWSTGSVTKFIITKFIRHKVYTPQSLYVTKFIQHKVYTSQSLYVTLFIRHKVYTSQSS
jgi:hypothetical protein